jgi:hypothetical protein
MVERRNPFLNTTDSEFRLLIKLFQIQNLVEQIFIIWNEFFFQDRWCSKNPEKVL